MSAQRYFVPDEKICPNCGETYHRPPGMDAAHWADRQFCSRKCVNAAQGKRRRTHCLEIQMASPKDDWPADMRFSDAKTRDGGPGPKLVRPDRASLIGNATSLCAGSAGAGVGI